MPLEKTAQDWCNAHPLLADLVALKESTWFNPAITPSAEALGDVPLTRADMDDASARLQRFAAFIQSAFPQTREAGGLIESPLYPLPALQKLLGADQGQLWLKADNELPISGSIKARGGIYEVLAHAERLALEA